MKGEVSKSICNAQKQSLCAVAATKQIRLQLLPEAVDAVSITQWSIEAGRLFQTRGPVTVVHNKSA